MNARKIRWSKVYESSEEELVDFLNVRRIQTDRWVGGAFEQLNPRILSADTAIYLAEGSASFTVENKNYSMQPGDAIQLPAATTLSVTVGMSGCICYETIPR